MKEYRIQIVLKNGQKVNLNFDTLQEAIDTYQNISFRLRTKKQLEFSHDGFGYYIPYESVAYVVYNTSPISIIEKELNDEQ